MAASDYAPLFEKYGKQHNIDPALLRSFAAQESGFNPKATNKETGAAGMMQLMPATAQSLKVDPYDPEQAVEGAARLLAEAFERNKGDLNEVIGEYYAGPNRKQWGPRTQKYQTEMLARYQGGTDEIQGGVDGILFGDDAAANDTPGPVDEMLFGENVPAENKAAFISMKGDKVVFGDTNEDVPAAQVKTITTLDKGGYFDPEAVQGSQKLPWVRRGSIDSFAPGDYYIDTDGSVLRVPGAEDRKGALAPAGAGLVRGVGDVVQSTFEILPDNLEPAAIDSMEAHRLFYNAEHEGDTVAKAGRFAGQLAVALPMLAGGQALLLPGLATKAGPAGAFLAGQGGKAMASGLGRTVTRGASLASRGAAEGAAAAGLVSSASDNPIGEQLAIGAVGGGVAGPLAPIVAAGGRKVGTAARDFVGKFTEEGREKVVSRILGEVSDGADINPDVRVLIPGSVPTLGESSGSAGIASLERNARTNPVLADRFLARGQQNAEARSAFFDRLRGDEHTLKTLEDAREATTAQLRETSFKGAGAADANPALDKIDEILRGPGGKRKAVVNALEEVRTNLYDAKGKIETDVNLLYGIRKDIADMLSPLASSERKGARQATRELMTVKAEIDKAIEKAAPGFKKYLSTYADMSKPVDEQNFLQSLKLVDSKGVITLGRVQAALDKIQKMQRANGSNEAKSVSKATLDDLRALRDDLKRAGNIDLGKARGSDTRQNLVMDKLANDEGLPLGLGAGVATGNPIVGLGVAAGKAHIGTKNKKVLDQLGSRLLEPGPTPVLKKPPVGTGKKGADLRPLLLPGTAGTAAGATANGQ